MRDAGRAAAAGEEPLIVLEYLGSQTGWLAAAAALARDEQNPAPHVVLVPERPVDLETVTDELRRAYQKYGYAVAVTTEGAKDTAGNSLDGPTLAATMSQSLGVPARYDRPGTLARVSQSAVARADADEAYNLGSLAVRLIEDECTDYLVTVQRDSPISDRNDRGYRSVEGTMRLDQVNDAPRSLPDNFINESGTNVSDAFLDWARPLVGGALPEYFALT